MVEKLVESELPGIEFVAPPVIEERPEPGTTKPRGRPKGKVNQATLDNLEKEIAESIVDMSAAIAPASPLVMAALDERADKTAHAIVILAGNSPRLINALKKTVKARAAVTLAETFSAVSVAALVEFNRLPYNSVMAQKFGVTENFERVYTIVETNGNGAEESRSRSGLFQ